MNVNVNVDNYNYVYGLVWTNNAVTSLKLCGIVVTYQVPFTTTLLPMVLKNAAHP